MTTKLLHQVDLSFHRRGLARRDFLRAIPLAGLAAGTLSWRDTLAARADDLRNRGMACILLWMQGGPSQFETLSPKPGHENGGETKAIATSVPGIEISENLPALAQSAGDLCIIRSMTSREGSHPRATYLMHTGYLPTASVKYPTLGSHVAHQLGDRAAELPNFVRVGGGRDGSAGGLLGVEFDPFIVNNPGVLPANTQPGTTKQRYQRRLNLVERLDGHYAQAGAKAEVADHQKLYDKAARMVLSPKMRTFDVTAEPPAVLEAYGESNFGKGCLLARRLVETGVTFVEVTLNGWDTHENNFERCKTLCGTMDRPMAQLIADLKDRGMLDTTLVVWMGEFGRTPRINPRTGRDHYPRAFNVALAGGGVKGGQVIGRTDEGGTSVADRPVGVSDLLRTICHGLKIDANHENMSSIGRPIKIVDGGEVVKDVFG
jgi:uncharacterized protein (DUF1501 family)